MTESKVEQRPALSRRESSALLAICDHVTRYGYPPSVRDLGAMLGLYSTSSTAYVLRMLEWKGYIRRDYGKPRAIQVLL